MYAHEPIQRCNYACTIPADENNMVEQLLVNGTENNSINMKRKHQLFIIIRIYPTST
jgi:hypothetical protein